MHHLYDSYIVSTHLIYVTITKSCFFLTNLENADVTGTRKQGNTIFTQLGSLKMPKIIDTLRVNYGALRLNSP